MPAERAAVKQDRAIRTRRAILEAAAIVFEEHGYEAAKLSEIISRARVTKGALYFHFASKEELALAVISAQFENAPTYPSRSPKLQELVDYGMTLAYRLVHDPLLRGSVRLTLDRGGWRLNRSGPYLGWSDLVTRLLREARGQGELLPHVVPEDTAAIFVGAYTGVNMMSQSVGSFDRLEQQVSSLYRHLMPGIAVPGVLAVLDMAPGRGACVMAEVERTAAEAE
ncbi:ScbR family autoregulator-binding transcription factor [Streptomyces sp. CNQ085]|uniref:ScbR family autoregulator-binding transcription factor n=1 Tax=Streptomyces sp. CNQ085 TaxID=2886944 RepID=UPI001F50B5B1|nr:ScbR family autoregulator-binding transcription factor [Streptomyces sp. CNQ085]MCI0385824.1 TetR/AcrR family transcriptional regulator [Streptomyces sp. CNQ085]